MRCGCIYEMLPVTKRFSVLTAFQPLAAHICTSFLKELRDRLITFFLFVRWQRLIARNVPELFSSNRGISHLNKACHIDELSRGSVLGPKILINH